MKLLTASLAFSLVVPPGVVAGSAPLPEHHRAWLQEEVVYIISNAERDAFVELVDDDARAAFITAFWLRRDPTPDTPANERKAEHERRLADANGMFATKRRPGWQTDRGRIHIQLGPPRDRIIYPADAAIRSIEQWTYHDHGIEEAPQSFGLLFFKPFGTGDWELYDPMGHGPESLTTRVHRRDRHEALSELNRFSVLLRNLSMSPNAAETPDIARAEVRPDSMRLFSVLRDFHNRPIAAPPSTAVASPSTSDTATTPTAKSTLTGLFLGGFAVIGGVVHYRIEIPAENVTLAREGERVRGDIELIGRIFDAESDRPVLRVDERLELSLSSDEHRRVRGFPLAYMDALPLLPGSYRARFLVRDGRVGEDIGIVSATFEVPKRTPSAASLGPLLLTTVSRATDDTGSQILPFHFLGRSWLPTVAGRVGTGGQLGALLEVALPVDRYRRSARTFDYRLVNQAGDAIVSDSAELTIDPDDSTRAYAVVDASLRRAKPGRYVLHIELSGAAPESRSIEFELRDGHEIVPPWVYPSERERGVATFASAVVAQCLDNDDEAGAIALLQGLVAGEAPAPARAIGRVQLAELHLQRDAFIAARDTIAPLASETDADPVVRLIMALAQSGAGDADGAIATLTAARAKAPDDVDVLNLLGEELYRAGQPEGARKVLNESLALDPSQREISELIESLATGG